MTVVMLPGVVRHPDRRVAAIVDYFEQLQLESLDHLATIYQDDARFKDPFNEVRGLVPIRRIFAHMFEALEQPRFVVTGRVVQGQQCFLTWDFLFAFKDFHKGVTQTVHGASHLVLDAQGQVTLHRDYWDAAEELYEKLPLIGAPLRWLRRRMSAE